MNKKIKEFMELYSAGEKEKALALLSSVFEGWLKEDQKRFQKMSAEDLIAYAAYYEVVGRNLRMQANAAKEREGLEDRERGLYLIGVDGILKALTGEMLTVAFEVPLGGEEDE